MIPSKIIPAKIHPGTHLKELLDEHGISQSALARHIGVKIGIVNEICNHKRGVSVQIAQRFAAAFNCSIEFWLNLQLAYELGRTKGKFVCKPIVGSKAA